MSDAPPGAARGEISGVKDPDDYRQRRRIKAILSARENFLEQRRKAMDLKVSGEIDDRLARTIIREAVDAYLMESEVVIRDHLPDDHRDAAAAEGYCGRDSGGSNGEGGGVQPETYNGRENWKADATTAYRVWYAERLGELELPSHTIVFHGLRDYMDAPDVFRDSWTEQQDSHVHGRETVKRQVEREIPRHVSKKAYRTLNDFWGQFGLDVELSSKMPTDHL